MNLVKNIERNKCYMRLINGFLADFQIGRLHFINMREDSEI